MIESFCKAVNNAEMSDHIALNSLMNLKNFKDFNEDQ